MSNMRGYRIKPIAGASRAGSALIWGLVFLPFFLMPGEIRAEETAADFIEFDDTPLEQDLVLPDWFTLSFLELKLDLRTALKGGKRGIILYFGRKDCPYCRIHLKKNWQDRGIVKYTRANFDVIAIDVKGDRPVIDLNGKEYDSEKVYAASIKANFTPSFLFIDAKGKTALRLAGYHPPYQFQAALEYVADGHYKKEKFRDYMARGATIASFEESEIHPHAVFSQPPYNLSRRVRADSELVVFFERPTCHACDVLHSGPLADETIVKKLGGLEVIQLDMSAKTPVLTPDGRKLTALQWADELGLYYAPTIMFFDAGGSEILRVDSVIRFYRLNGVLDYISSKGYKTHSTYQLWRQHFKR